MHSKIKEISDRVREMRDLSGFTAEKMASELNIAPAEYEKYESGTVDIPASVLYEISHILKLDMGTLLTGQEPRVNVFTVTHKGKGVIVDRHNQYSYQNLAANFIHKKAEPFLVTVEPKPAGFQIKTNSHPGQEFDYLLHGRMKIYIHNNEIELEPGDSIFFDSSCPHAMEAIGNEPAKFLAMIL